MHTHWKALAQNFALGGLLTTVVSYIGTFLSPVLGAIVWSYPFSMVPTLYFMLGQGRSMGKISHYAMIGTFAIILEFIGTGALAHFIRYEPKTDMGVSTAIVKSIGVWSIFSIIFYKVIQYMGWSRKFI